MLASIDTPEFLERIHQRSRQVARGLVERIRERASPRRMKAGENLLACLEPGCVYVVNGVFRLQYLERTVRMFSDGDLLLIDPHSGVQDCRAEAAFSSEVLHFTRMDLLAGLQGAPQLLHQFMELMSLESQILQVLCGLVSTSPAQPQVQFARFEPGDVIVEQGQQCPEIYEILEGSGMVEVDGRPVGSVRAGEFIGELSFLTGMPCNATVTAAESCFVQSIPKAEFTRLIHARPQAAVRLAQILAERVRQLDRQIVS